MQTNWRRLTREELYDLVWSKPTVQLTKEFLVSNVAIAKRCKSLGIPKSSLGYWRKIETGERPKLIPLPKPGQKLPTPTIQR